MIHDGEVYATHFLYVSSTTRSVLPHEETSVVALVFISTRNPV